MESVLFPHENIRPAQKGLMDEIKKAVSRKETLFTHAPTGLGKTAAALSTTLPTALEKDLTVFFLTNRHTQHQIAVETLQKIRKKYDKKLVVADIIGKKWMCLQDDVQDLYSQEFTEFCKTVRENNMCEFYNNTYKSNSSQLGVKAEKTRQEVEKRGLMKVSSIKNICSRNSVCPYYLTVEMAKDSDVVIADYYTVFHPSVQQNFFSRLDKKLGESIIIVDEGHNLPSRIRGVMSTRLSNYALDSALKEAKKFDFDEEKEYIRLLQEIMKELYRSKLEGEREAIIKKRDIKNKIDDSFGYKLVQERLKLAGDEVRESQKKSSLARTGEFLEGWDGDDKGYVRYMEKRKSASGKLINIHYSCLDAAEVAGPVFSKAHSSIVMSGTLTPIDMFQDVLGASRSKRYISDDPFPEENRKVLIIPNVTTKYSDRSDIMFKRIADNCVKIANSVPGSSVFFFPSYALRDKVMAKVDGLQKRAFIESSGMNTEEKARLLRNFKENKDKGAALFGVMAANFSEGIDLPGNYLKAVTIIGLPLARPDVRTKALINYYDDRFGKGWNYGYIYPAMIKCLQAAGRCIRSEKDRGMIFLLDKRYTWSKYFSCLPSSWNPKTTHDCEGHIEHFFSR